MRSTPFLTKVIVITALVSSVAIAIYTCLAGPATDDKELLLTLDVPNLINSLSGFSERAMEAFLTAVGASGAAR